MRPSQALALLSLAAPCLAATTKRDALPGLDGDVRQRALKDGRDATDRPKNVVFILTDDQDLVLDSPSYMPRLKEHIVDKGKTFANHFVTTAICCPSRVALLTGRQAHNTNVTDVSPPYGGYPKFVSQGFNDAYLPVWLQDAGYATYYTGKLFNAHSTTTYNNPFVAGWNASDFLIDPGTYSYLNPIYQRNHDDPVFHRNEHTTDLIVNKTRGFLDDAIKGTQGSDGKPFFVGVAPVAPHADMEAKSNTSSTSVMTEPIPLERHAHLFPDAKVPRTDNFNPDASSGVSWVNGLPQFSDDRVDYLDHFYRQRLRALQGVDELVEQIVNQLDEAGLLEETYIIFTSDNGYHIGNHRLPPGKECGFEEDIRVPFYVRGPGINEGAVEDTVTTHIDLAPTFFGIANTPPRDDFDGTAMPLLDGEAASRDITRHEHVAVEYWGTAIAEGPPAGGFNGQTRVQNNTYKAVRIIGDHYDLYYSVWCNNEHELYNVQADPGQMNNFLSQEAGGPTNATLLHTSVDRVVDRLDALMMVLKSCKSDSCIKPWAKLHPEGDVASLTDALNAKFDDFYAEQVQVEFDHCEAGYLIEAEGPQTGFEYREGTEWHHWT